MSFDYTVSKLNSLKKSQQDSKTAREEEERKEAVAKLRTKQRAEVGCKSSFPLFSFAYCKQSKTGHSGKAWE